MMTINEDDTFNALRRIPIIEMWEIVSKNTNHYSKITDKWFKQYGWTRIEYDLEWSKWVESLFK